MNGSHTLLESTGDRRYARILENSRRVRWDIDEDVLRGRDFDFSGNFLPDGLTLLGEADFLGAADRRLMSQIQGRTYAAMFALVERFITAKVLDLSRGHALGDQIALEALVGMGQEELKHQEMFRRIERMIGARMPEGYRFLPDADGVAAVVLGKSTWAVLALTCHIEIFVQAHYLESIQPDASLSPLFKDVFLHHWKDEAQHVVADELEWTREDRRLGPEARDRAVDELIELVGAVDGIVQAQAAADLEYFRKLASVRLDDAQTASLGDLLLRAYRHQYILSGARHPRFAKLLTSMLTPSQAERVSRALAPIAG